MSSSVECHSRDATPPYDAILVVSFGGPEGPDDVMPFLENVLRGKNVPRERMLEVAEHYHHFGGVSPINQQCRELIAALRDELDRQGPKLPVYWGNRNWHPLLPDTLRRMRDDGIQRALAFMTSAFSSYSGCRQYREDIQRAQTVVGEGAPRIDKLRVFYNHPCYIVPMRERLAEALEQISAQRRSASRVLFTAHSIPLAMAAGCDYEQQLRESSRLVAEAFPGMSWDLVYQSRSGPASQPWLEPDICDFLRALSEQRDVGDVVVVPIGFISDHMEVLFDLDTEARKLCQERGLNMVRAATVGTHPRFIQMIRELVLERVADGERLALGSRGPNHDLCPVACCPSGRPAPAVPPTSPGHEPSPAPTSGRSGATDAPR
ncbi:MAG: ferrochelatase [Planctomycetes bacterium]|nr:ferrochelatase [Planctomycetota bacterium]